MTAAYNLRDGFALNGNKDEIGARLDELADEKGNLTPEDVLEDAEDESSPLHDCFEWDDTEAAHQYRLQQARYVIRAFEVVYKDKEDDEIVVVKFVNTGDRTNSEPYRDVFKLMSDKQHRERYVRMVLRKLKVLRMRYRNIKELADIFDAIDRVAASIK
jgi:hypothetical protein